MNILQNKDMKTENGNQSTQIYISILNYISQWNNEITALRVILYWVEKELNEPLVVRSGPLIYEYVCIISYTVWITKSWDEFFNSKRTVAESDLMGQLKTCDIIKP